MKYIDAEKLKSEIERLQRAAAITMEELQMDEPSERMRGELDAYDDILYFIDSLQQEQREVDLEKEIDACWQNWLSPSNQKEVEGVLPKIEFAMYARHFAEWGAIHLNTKKEE